jgi:hypothetical protein
MSYVTANNGRLNGISCVSNRHGVVGWARIDITKQDPLGPKAPSHISSCDGSSARNCYWFQPRSPRSGCFDSFDRAGSSLICRK